MVEVKIRSFGAHMSPACVSLDLTALQGPCCNAERSVGLPGHLYRGACTTHGRARKPSADKVPNIAYVTQPMMLALPGVIQRHDISHLLYPWPQCGLSAFRQKPLARQ